MLLDNPVLQPFRRGDRIVRIVGTSVAHARAGRAADPA
jgi:hypothetical protein